MTDRKDESKIGGITASLIAVVAFSAGIVYGANLPNSGPVNSAAVNGYLEDAEDAVNNAKIAADEDYKIQMTCIDVHYAPENYEKAVTVYCESRLESDQKRRNNFKANIMREMDIDSLLGLRIIQEKVEQ